MEAAGWATSSLDGALWLRFDKNTGALPGICVEHADDLLFAGGAEAYEPLQAVGSVLGFGKVPEDDFTRCGKRIRRCSKTRHICVSMEEYHENMSTVYIPKERLRCVESPLSP